MKTNLSIFGLFACIFSSCAFPHYLPSKNNIGVSQYGSHIQISPQQGNRIQGELIAIDSSIVVVLSHENRKCTVIPLNQVRRFELKYARTTEYGWTIPLAIINPFVHGYAAIYTMPLHLAVTVLVTYTGNHAFTFSHHDMTFDQLSMFARFPQGIPPHIDLSDIQ